MSVFSDIHGASQVLLVVKKLPANTGDIRDEGFIPGLERSPGGAQRTTVQGVAKSRTQLNN